MLVKLLIFALIPLAAIAYGSDCLDLNLRPNPKITYAATPAEDFALRDSLPQTEVARVSWRSCCGSFGPCPLSFPKVIIPQKNHAADWSFQRVIEVAKKYIGLPYGHYHIPAMGGLDCSNYTSWVYNYGFGIRFTSNIRRQALEAGRQLSVTEPYLPGDLIFLYSAVHKEISHVAIYVDERNIIDSTGVGVKIRPFTGRYKTNFAWARRILE